MVSKMGNGNLSGEFIIGKEKNLPIEKEEIKFLEQEKINKKNRPYSQNNLHFYSSLCYRPEGLEFQEQELNEEIILLVKRDFITNVPWIISTFFLLIVPPLFSFFFQDFLQQIHLSFFTKFIIISFYYLSVFAFAVVKFAVWYFNVALATNIKLIDVDVDGILYKNISETKLDLVQDVSYTQIGVIRSVFNYGDVLIQTAGSLPNFEIDRAPEPAKIVRIIGDLIGKDTNDNI